MPAEKLIQYAARGTAIHSMVAKWRETGEWNTNNIMPEDRALLENGSEKLIDTIPQFNFPGFMAEHGKEIVFSGGEERGYNDEHSFTGQPDAWGFVEDKKTIFDIKTGSINEDECFMQMAAYAYMPLHPAWGSEVMIIIPLTAKNKSGYQKPIISEDVDGYYQKFLAKLNELKRSVGL